MSSIVKRKYTDEQLINILKGYAESAGKTPTYTVFEKDPTVPSAAVYKKRFGSWNTAIQLAGLEANAIRIVTKDEIKQEVLNYYHRTGFAPNYNDLKYSRAHVKNYWENWTEMIIDLGIPLNRKRSAVTDETELLVFLKNLYDDLGAIPTTRHVEEKGVNRNLYTHKFGSFRNALIKAGIVTEDYFKPMEERVPESINAIIEFYKTNKKVPTVQEYEAIAKRDNLAHRKALESILEKSYSEICMDYLGVANQYKRTKEELIEDLKWLKSKLGRTPLATELTDYGLAEKKQYYRTFNMTYNELIEKLGWELSSPKLLFKSVEELLEDYMELFNQLGRIPLYSDIDKQEWMASARTYKKYFGDLPFIWKALNLEVDSKMIEQNYGMGLICIDKNEEFCRSYPEMIITNIIIDLDLKYEKEVRYNRIIPNLGQNYKCDWLLIDSNIVIEYFGLFSEKALKKDDMVGRYTRKVLKKIEILKQYNVKYIDIYPEDLETVEEKLKSNLKISSTDR